MKVEGIYPAFVTVSDDQTLALPMYFADDQIGELRLRKDGVLEFEWESAWIGSCAGNPLLGIPVTTEVIAGAKVHWVFDNFFIPTSKVNLHSALKRAGLDPEDHSDWNRRMLLFKMAYREYSLSFGAPCSHFDAQVSTTLLPECSHD